MVGLFKLLHVGQLLTIVRGIDNVGEILLTEQTAHNEALAAANNNRIDEIIKVSHDMISEAEKLIPVAIVVADDDDSSVEDDEDENDEVFFCVIPAVQHKLQTFFAVASTTMIQIAQDVPSNPALAQLANTLHVLKIRILKYCISCPWVLTFYNSLHRLNSFINLSEVTSVGACATSRGLPGGDKTKKRAKRSVVQILVHMLMVLIALP
jgi:hypothetical protein